MTDQQLNALTTELDKHNSRLVTSESTDDTILIADIDGTVISEWRLLAFLNRFSVPFQEITFHYHMEGIGLAAQGRYWAIFHL